MDTASLLFRLGLALAIGLLIGTERHWRERDEAAGSRTAGIRTYGIIGLTGGVVAAVAHGLGATNAGGGLLIGLAFVAFSATFGVFKWRESEEDHDYSVTTVVVGQATFLLGSLAVFVEPAISAAATIALALVLTSRDLLHGFIEKLEWVELRSAILLLAMAFVVLPLLPDRQIGPFGGVNPAGIWVFAIALAGVSYAGYLAVKLFGSTRGPLIAGLAGGLASSTAVALTSARQSVDNPNIGPIAAGALAASAVSALRAIAIVLALQPDLLSGTGPVLGAAALVLTVAAGIAMMRGGAASDAVAAPRLGNPFQLSSVIKLALLIAVFSFLARATAAHFGSAGTMLVSAIMGLVDIDAVILSVVRLVGSSVGSVEIQLSILIAVATNLVAKAAYSFALGSRPYALLIAVVSALALIAGGITALMVL